MERRGVYLAAIGYLDPISAIAEQLGFSQSKVENDDYLGKRQKLQSHFRKSRRVFVMTNEKILDAIGGINDEAATGC